MFFNSVCALNIFLVLDHSLSILLALVLRFEPWPLETATKVQPAVIRVWRPAIADIAVTVVAASELWDIFFYLFVPFTVFTVR